MPYIIIVMLFVLSSPALAIEYHTPPHKWDKPRIFHTPVDKGGKLFNKTIAVSQTTLPPLPDEEKNFSFNEIYWFTAKSKDTKTNGMHGGTLYIYNERDYLITISFSELWQDMANARWINEKLLYVEWWWGRIMGAYFIFDVEKEIIITSEEMWWGGNAFQQWKTACKNGMIDEPECRKEPND